MKVVVDPVDDIQYMSFYLYALRQRYGAVNVRFDTAPFTDLSTACRSSKSVRLVADGRRVAIDCNDFSSINNELYAWCDVYGKINATARQVELHDKLVLLCPSMAVRYMNRTQCMWAALQTMHWRSTSLRRHFGRWRRTSLRPTYEAYQPTIASTGYLFHCSTLWQSDEWNGNDEQVNLYRARFIRAARAQEGIHFEGGLVSSRTDDKAHQFDDCLTYSYPPQGYLDCTRRSAFVFNTPAYWGCHGWKLGEYMALGKAVLSTPLINSLPAPLEHGKHLHIVDGTDEAIAEGIRYMTQHADYRHYLEQNIRAYWQQYGAPEATLNRLGL